MNLTPDVKIFTKEFLPKYAAIINKEPKLSKLWPEVSQLFKAFHSNLSFRLMHILTPFQDNIVPDIPHCQHHRHHHLHVPGHG